MAGLWDNDHGDFHIEKYSILHKRTLTYTVILEETQIHIDINLSLIRPTTYTIRKFIIAKASYTRLRETEGKKWEWLPQHHI